ncbi:hypothetical protein A5717_19045 [Mycolicibacterium porcinum]|uniref:nSTAND1 domain-containing NTPase n=1 Tax=Mycolicibacterium porcinum TaxID=39693 RepID=UPI00080B41D9|nr:TIR domain-containing protein [Mycolicibacterium porcinum]OCB11813.1 hypothetical protein A5717_19045 [Mycolicibacterium porcinum]
MSRIFLSHSSRNNRQAIALKHWLEQAEPGLAGEIFLDLDGETGIRTGVRWTDALWHANARCEAVICLVSKDWVASKECHTEFRQAEGMGKPIFCARLEKLEERDISRAWQSCDLFGGPSEEVALDGESPVRLSSDGLHRLLTGLRAVGVGADSFPWPPPGDVDRSPYRGWQPLESVDAAIYFGRDAQIQRALDELRSMRDTGLERMFVILGASGVGKSSFLRAGLLPRLRRDDRRFLTLSVVRPERHALTGDAGLARSIHRLRDEVGLRAPSLGEIKNAIHDSDQLRGWLAEAVAAARDRVPDLERPPTLVLPLDQAEELFGVDAGEEGQAFLELLGRLLTDVDLDMVVVATIRSDRYEPLQTAPQLSAVQSHLFDRLKAMPQAQFAEVICGPARRAAESGSRFELAPELVDRLVEDASGGADTLPLLALTLSRLYEDYVGSDDAVTVDQYEAMGGMRRVVQNEIDNLLSPDPAERSQQLDRLHDAFIPWLATVNSDTGQPMRRIARWADLPEESHSLLNAFVGRRLLVKGEREGQVVVEVALESLLHQWDELAEWLRAEASELREADALERAVAAWERSGNRDEWLFDGTRLEDAEILSTQPGFGARLNPAGEFLLASRRRVNRKLEAEKSAAQAHARSLRRRSQVLVALLAVVVVAAAFAFVSQKQARSAERKAVAAKLAGQARAMLGETRLGGDRRAILQMLAAEKLEGGADPDSLLNTLIDTRRLERVITVPTTVTNVDVSPDGRQFVSSGKDGLIRRWNLESGESEGDPLTGHSGAAGAAYVRDGRWIASAGSDKTVRIWDAATGAAVRVLTGVYDPDRGTVAMSDDGELLATGVGDGMVQLWDVGRSQPVGKPIRAHDSRISAAAFSRDRSRLVTAGQDGTVRMWDVSTGLQAGPSLPSHRGSVVAVAFSQDGRRIASMSILVGQEPPDELSNADGIRTGFGPATQLRITDAASGQPVVDGKIEFGYGGYSLVFSPDGQRVAVGYSDGTIRLRDTTTGAEVGSRLSGHTGPVNSVVFSRDGTRIISGGDNTIHVWSAKPARSIGTWLPGPTFDGSWSLPAAVSPDGGVVATRDVNNQSDIALWRMDTREHVRTISTGYRGAVSALAWRPDGQAVASADGADTTARIWNVQTGEPETPALTGPDNAVVGLYFSPNGRYLASLGVDSDPWLWDTSASPPRATALRGDEDLVNSVGFSADGRRLITVAPMHLGAGDHDKAAQTGNVFDAPESTPSAVRVWDTDTGKLAGPPLTSRGGGAVDVGMDVALGEREAPIFAAAISPDGKRILVATSNELRLHDAATGQPVGEPWVANPSGQTTITSLTFSPDGDYVVSNDAQTSDLQLREARTGRPVGKPLAGHEGQVINVAFTADGNHIVSQGQDGWVLWPGPDKWADELCHKLTANMTEAEWDEWVSTAIDYQPTCPPDAHD